MNYDFVRPSKACVRTLLFITTTLALSDVQCVMAAEPVTVEISRFQFAPQELTVAPGTTVRWVNRDQTIHNVLTIDGQLTSPGLDTDDGFSFVFDREGDYSYHCGLHPQMVGVVHVRGRSG
jgi:plastocyanin